MTTKLIALAAASALSVTAAASSAHAQGMMNSMDMLSGYVHRILLSNGIPADKMMELTLAQTSAIIGCVEGEENNTVDKKQCVQAAIAKKN
jgi:hypothetical protein